MKKEIEIEIDTLTQFIACFMYGNYDRVLIESQTGERVKAVDIPLSVLDGIKIKFIKGIYFDLNTEMYIVEVK